MHRKHYFWVAMLSLWGIVFSFVSETVPDDQLPLFVPSWFEAVKALVVGIAMGGLLRIKKIKSFLLQFTAGRESFLRVGFGVLGLGFMGMGVVGALLAYAQFENIHAVLVPLNASVIGLAVLAMHVVMNWEQNEI